VQNCHSSFCILAKEDKRSSVCSDCHISRCGVGFCLALSVSLRANGLQGLLNERIGTENELVPSRIAPPKGIFSSKHNGLDSARSVCPCVHGVQESISRESGILPGEISAIGSAAESRIYRGAAKPWRIHPERESR
jgi:hypothetical protein